VPTWTAGVIVACIWSLLPVLIFGFATDQVRRLLESLPVFVRLIIPAVLGFPYLFALGTNFQPRSLLFYLCLPIVVALVLWHAQQSDPEQRGNWRDFLVLLLLGLAVDLRWLEPAWPSHLSVLSKLILLDAGLYGFLAVRQLDYVGFDLRVRGRDLAVGLRELVFYAPLAIPLGLGLGFLHFHRTLPASREAAFTLIFTFILIAIPEEIFFRGWMQNLLERRMGRIASLLLTSVIFGLSHFNKRATHFNWRYVLLATIAGIFYGRAWRYEHRIAASSITHACVDTIWSVWQR
jgi:membrane protease YdiL (CAAX protease family)